MDDVPECMARASGLLLPPPLAGPPGAGLWERPRGERERTVALRLKLMMELPPPLACPSASSAIQQSQRQARQVSSSNHSGPECST
jgi:hypothetical protein